MAKIEQTDLLTIVNINLDLELKRSQLENLQLKVEAAATNREKMISTLYQRYGLTVGVHQINREGEVTDLQGNVLPDAPVSDASVSTYAPTNKEVTEKEENGY